MSGSTASSCRRRIAALLLAAGALVATTSCAPDVPDAPSTAPGPTSAESLLDAALPGDVPAPVTVQSDAAAGDAAELWVEPLGRLVYGCVATHWCDPVSGVRVLLGDREMARTSRWGDFCATGLPPGDVVLSFERAGFTRAEVVLPAGVDRLECQPLLGPDDGDGEDTFRVTVNRGTLRGPEGAEVVVRDASTGEELLRTTTSVLGTFLVPVPLRNRATEVAVTWGDPPQTTVTTGRLTPWLMPRFYFGRGMAKVRLDRRELARGGTLRDTWYHVGHGGRMSHSDGGDGAPWSLTSDTLGLTAWAVVSTHDRLVSRPVPLLSPEQDARLTPRAAARLVLHPLQPLSAAEVRVVAPWGPDDVISAVRLEDVPARGAKRHSIRHADMTDEDGGLATPYLDVGAGVVMLVHEDRRRERRILFDARLPADLDSDTTLHREVDVATGTGRLVVRLQRDGDAGTEMHGVLARRGGAYYLRKRVAPNGEAVFDGLCAGTFTFWFQESRANGDAVSGFFDIRGVRVAPDAEVVLNARWAVDPPRAEMERTEIERTEVERDGRR